MSDPRATSRGSKTAAVVMLVVFLQVMIVAILGLGAIGRDRQEAQRYEKNANRRRAVGALSNILHQSRQEVLDALSDVKGLDSYADLQALRRDPYRGRHADLIQTVYQVDPERGVIYWIDGDHRLLVPALVRAAEIQESQIAETAAVIEAMEADYARAEGGPVSNRVRFGVPLCRKYPYLEVRENRYPKSLGRIGRLVREVSDEAAIRGDATAGSVYRDLEEVLLAALEIVALNADRRGDIPLSDLPKLTEIPDLVEATVIAIPPSHSAIGDHVEAYRRAREALEEPSLRAALELAVEDQRLEAMRDDQDVVSYGPHLIGVVRWAVAPAGGEPRHLLVLMSESAVLHLVRETATALLSRLGLDLDLRLVSSSVLAAGAGASTGTGEAGAESDEPGAVNYREPTAAQNLQQVPGLRLPYRAELVRKEPERLPSGGPGEFFYWGIILLSATGLVWGGWVLMRIYTREVRLARLKADFVSNLSHELKTPLTSIAMWTELLQDERMTADEDRKEALGVLAQESERLQSIVHRMLDTAKREARGSAYELVPGDLNDVVGRAADRFRRITTEPGLDLRIELHSQPLPVRMDPAAMDDLVSNLVSNAWKYKRGDEARVEVRTALRGRKSEITVADDGLGIPRKSGRRSSRCSTAPTPTSPGPRARGSVYRSSGPSFGRTRARSASNRAWTGRVPCSASVSR